MLYIEVKTNKILTLKQQRELKVFIHNLLSEMYNTDIIVQLEQEQVIYLNTKMTYCIILNCNKKINKNYKNKMIQGITMITSIPEEHIYIVK